ncbi:MAG: hypothetical protein V4563_04880 [Pseudomonadota bacterium]
MSPLWRDRLTLAIAPQRIVLVRTHGWLRPQVVAKSIVDVPAAHPVGGWQAALDTLAHTLQTDAQWQGLAVNAVLSNHFVRYQLIPWSAQISNADERAAYVRASFAQVYGDTAAQWAYSVSNTRRGAAWFAGAVDQPLLTQLEDVLGQSQSPLRSAAPYLMPAYNQARRAIKEKDLWFVQVEPQKLLLLLILDGHWHAVGTHPVDADWPAQLPLLLEREWHLYGTGTMPRKLVITAPDTPPATLDEAGQWQVQRLPLRPHPGLDTDSAAPYAMALGT